MNSLIYVADFFDKISVKDTSFSPEMSIQEIILYNVTTEW